MTIIVCGQMLLSILSFYVRQLRLSLSHSLIFVFLVLLVIFVSVLVLLEAMRTTCQGYHHPWVLRRYLRRLRIPSVCPSSSATGLLQMYIEIRPMHDPYDIHSGGFSDYSAIIAEGALCRKSIGTLSSINLPVNHSFNHSTNHSINQMILTFVLSTAVYIDEITVTLGNLLWLLLKQWRSGV